MLESRAAEAPTLTSSSDADALPGFFPLTITAFRERDLIEAAVAQVFNVELSALTLPTRGKKRVALARQAAMYLAHIACGLNLKETGTLFSRDRTTVAYACEVIEDRRDDPVFDHAMQLLEWIIPALLAPHRHRLSHQT